MTLTTISVAALSVLLGTTEVARADCTPAAIALGEATLVASVTARLTANGVSTVAIAGCPAVHVHLEQRGPKLHLRVADGYQRRGEREVQDIATAAAVIESWTLQEVEDGTLPELAAQPGLTAVALAPPPIQRQRLHIGLAGQSALANDGTRWLGGELAGCMRVSWWCIGVSTSLTTATSPTNNGLHGAQRSSELHALVTLDVPRAIGRYTASPGIGLGYGWLALAQEHADIHMMPQSIEYTSHALRTRAHVTLARQLGERVSIFGGVFGDAAALRTSVPDGSAPRARLGVSLGLRVGL